MDLFVFGGAVLFPSVANAVWAALKYYSGTLGDKPESFSMSKFAPFVILGVGISLYTALTMNSAVTAENALAIMGQNLGYLVTINLALGIISKWPISKKIVGKLTGSDVNGNPIS